MARAAAPSARLADVAHRVAGVVHHAEGEATDQKAFETGLSGIRDDDQAGVFARFDDPFDQAARRDLGIGRRDLASLFGAKKNGMIGSM